MEEFTCHYIGEWPSVMRAVYHADCLQTAMAMHNVSQPKFKATVLKWSGEDGLVYRWTSHDPSLTMEDV